mmetsp:Transcript_632/g.2230  ORF Transcript_632/g.2230 Transcript_632/m.2230 type:complete len:341 (+) Transcript_632:1-1023(+)
MGSSDYVAVLHAALNKRDFAEALRTLERAGVGREQVVAHRDRKGWKRPSVLTVVLGGLPEEKRPWPEEWEALARRVLELVTPADLLTRKNRIATATTALDEEFVTAMVEKCMGEPEFTEEARLKVLEGVVLNPWPALAAMLVDGLDPSLFCRRRFLRVAIEQGRTAVFMVLADALSDDQLLHCRGKDTLLHTACAKHAWEIVEVLLNRTPEALTIAGRGGEGAIHQPYREPPLDLWRRIVEGTPEELLLHKDKETKRTILHRTVHMFKTEHLEVLIVYFPHSGRKLRCKTGETALQLAQKKAEGKLKVRTVRNRDDVVVDGLAMVEILGVGAMTKAAGVR